jgi:hypothetical protein
MYWIRATAQYYQESGSLTRISHKVSTAAERRCPDRRELPILGLNPSGEGP